MGFLSRLFRADADGRAAHDDFWYRPVSGPTLSGVRVDSDTALKLSAVWACVRLISESVASLPFVLYQRRSDGGKDRADWHPLYDILHDQPNKRQTAIQWRQQMTADALLRGSGYSRLVAGPRGPADQLIPLAPDRVTPIDGGERFRYRRPDGRDEMIMHDEIFEVGGLSLDGVTTVSVIEYARESLGIGMAAEQYAGRVFSQDGRPRGVLEHPGKLSKDAAERLSASWHETYAGLSNAHKVAILQEGMKFSKTSVTPDDAQMLSSREFSVEDVCRWFGVPPHMVGSTAKVTSWGTGIEQLSIGFVVYSLLPWLTRWEQSVRRDLIKDERKFFAEHIVDGLVRGDIHTRYQSYSIGRQNGWLSANDVRRMENMNSISGGDQYMMPLNMAPVGQQPNGQAADEWETIAAAAITNGSNGHAQ